MEVNTENLQALAACLQRTLSPDPAERKAAEKFLESVEGNANYSILLLNLIKQDATSINLRVSASIILKNFVKRHWPVTEEEVNKISVDDRTMVKNLIVGLMLTSPEQIQKQLSDAISIIGSQDFPNQWPGLLQEMVDKFKMGDFNVINGVLCTAHSLFKKYRHLCKSESLWREIKFVLDNFAAPLTELLNATMELAKAHAENVVALKVIYSSLLLICKIFYSLNFQDIPEYFEDNMRTWMGHFHVLLTSNVPLLNTDDKEEPGLMEQIKTQICDNLSMYAQKYEEEFSNELQQFVFDTWQLLISTGVDVKYDLLVSNAIQFLASVAERPCYKNYFESPETLSSLCEKVIVPNMEFRDADEDTFEDNPEEYIRRDIEGSDVETRRRAACDLVRALLKSFEDSVVQNFSVYVQHMLQEYAKNPSKNWKSKDAAIFLVTSLAAKAKTEKHGVTQTRSLVNVVDFFSIHIAPDLQSPNVNDSPVLKADAIKYLMVFRNQLPRELLLASISPLITLMRSNSHVIHSYAACCLEKILTVRIPGAGQAITKDDLASHSNLLLSNLFTALTFPGSQENEYIMKCIMRSLAVLQEKFIEHVETIINALVEKLLVVSKNPSKPNFNHCLFESICVVITVTCGMNPELVSSFEVALFPPFQTILQQDVLEFIPYVFQVLSLLLEINPAGVSEAYKALFSHLLRPELYERPANIPPVARLLQAYVSKGAKHITSTEVMGLLGVFQKLLSSKANVEHGFDLLCHMTFYMPNEMLSHCFGDLFRLIFQALQSNKTPKHAKGAIMFFCLYAIKYSPTALFERIDQIQTKMFGMVVEKVFLPNLAKVSDSVQKKICAVGVTKILAELPQMLLPDCVTHWPQLLQALISLMELPQTSAEEKEDVTLDLSEGFNASYSLLVFAKKPNFDPCSDISNVHNFLVKSLSSLISVNMNVKTLISNGLQQETLDALKRYFMQAGIQI